MNYNLGFFNQEKLVYYDKIRKEMNDMKKEPIKKGITLNWNIDEKMNKFI